MRPSWARQASPALLAMAVALVLAPPAARAAGTPAPPPRDSVAGSGTTAAFPNGFRVDVSSGPSGEDPTGGFGFAVQIRPPYPVLGAVATRSITCLAVHGNTATAEGPVAIVDPFYADLGYGAKMTAVDNGGAGPDAFGAVSVYGTLAPSDCDTPAAAHPVTGGDIVVTDARPLPARAAQCRHGGWRDYGDRFRNQGGCVTFVLRQGVQACLAERKAIGPAAFRERYGTPGLLRCVALAVR